MRVKRDPNVLGWIGAADESMLFLSVLTLGEARKGVEAIPQGRRRTQLETWLEVDLRNRFAERIVPIDPEIANRWGFLAARAKREGKPLSTVDGLLAATAIHLDLTVATRNVADFASLEVPVLNPWRS